MISALYNATIPIMGKRHYFHDIVQKGSNKYLNSF